MVNINWVKYQNEKYGAKVDRLLFNFLKKYDGEKNAVDLGCGSCNETVYLLKKGFKVTSIDKQINKKYIYDRIEENLIKNVTLIEDSFENIDIPKTNLIIALYSIPFCLPENFNELWDKIYKSLNTNGYFVGQLFGNRDDWKNNSEINTFSIKQVKKMLKNYKILKFEEVEYVRITDNKKWHYYNIIAQKL